MIGGANSGSGGTSLFVPKELVGFALGLECDDSATVFVAVCVELNEVGMGAVRSIVVLGL